MNTPVAFLLLIASIMALCQGAPYNCSAFFSRGYHCPFISCNTTDVAVSCHYRYIYGIIPLPMWRLDGQEINATSLTLTKCNDTISQMVYDFSGLCPGEYVFHGKYSAGSEMLEYCCGPEPEVHINLTLTAKKTEAVVTCNQTTSDGCEGTELPTTDEDKPDERDELDKVVLQLGRSMKELVLGIVKTAKEAIEKN